jgi:hypothetical protein
MKKADKARGDAEKQATLDGVVTKKKRANEFTREVVLQELAKFVSVANQVSAHDEIIITLILIASDPTSHLP